MLESRPNENLTSELADDVFPIAKTTWLGSSEPAEQAEPLDAQMPSKSNPASNQGTAVSNAIGVHND